MARSKPFIAVDLFCGGGGFSEGVARACERMGVKDVQLFAVNHWKLAVESHRKNHPWAKHYWSKINQVNPRDLVPRGRMNLLVASHECFPEGTLILTDSGLIPIEHVRKGMKVLTHRNRWMPVTDTFVQAAKTVTVKGHGHYGLEMTGNHPIWTRNRRKRWPKSNRSGVWTWSDPTWRPAKDAGERFWATPTQIPKTPVPMPAIAGKCKSASSLWWIVGRWLGDGSVDVREKRGGAVSISCGSSEVKELSEVLDWAMPRVLWKKRKLRTAFLFDLYDTNFTSWLVKNFGRLSHGKTLPTWALGMPREWREALLAGYLSADGYENGRKTDATTVSKNLAIGIRLLAESLGHRVALHKYPQHCKKIEGRVVNVRDVYRMVWVNDPKHKYSAEIGTASWSRIRTVNAASNLQRVYNIEVKEDESYVADGVIVHNCTNHSIARGGRPVNDQSRSTAWDILKFPQELYIESIIIENVREFTRWGPLGADGRPLKSKIGQTYQAYLDALRALGYTVQERILNSADFGAATTRERLFIIARRGNRPIVWPHQTHTKDPHSQDLFRKMKPWRPAKTIIDWDTPGKSIFNRKKPLAPSTIERIAAGLKKFGGAAAEPFLVMLYGTGKARSVDRPMPTVTAKGQHIGLCEPFIITPGGPDLRGGRSVNNPLPTVVCKDRMGVVEPYLIPFFGERKAGRHSKKGQNPRTHSIEKHVPAVTSHGAGGLVVPFIMAIDQRWGKGTIRPVTKPMGTICTKQAFAVVIPTIVRFNGGKKGKDRVHSVDNPLPVVDTSNRYGLVNAMVISAGGPEGQGRNARSVDQPIGTVLAEDHKALVQAFMIPLVHGKGDKRTYDLKKPMPTLTSVDAWGLIQPFITKYFGTSKGAKSTNKPLDTVTGKDRFALVTPQGKEIKVGGTIKIGKKKMRIAGLFYMDILFRMLHQHELAAAMGFPKKYTFAGNREAQVKQIGNAVEVNMATALVKGLIAR